jgi:hypothetical protein
LTQTNNVFGKKYSFYLKYIIIVVYDFGWSRFVIYFVTTYFLRTKVEPEKNFGFKLNILVQLFYSDVSGTTTCVDIFSWRFITQTSIINNYGTS